MRNSSVMWSGNEAVSSLPEMIPNCVCTLVSLPGFLAGRTASLQENEEWTSTAQRTKQRGNYFNLGGFRSTTVLQKSFAPKGLMWSRSAIRRTAAPNPLWLWTSLASVIKDRTPSFYIFCHFGNFLYILVFKEVLVTVFKAHTHISFHHQNPQRYEPSYLQAAVPPLYDNLAAVPSLFIFGVWPPCPSLLCFMFLPSFSVFVHKLDCNSIYEVLVSPEMICFTIRPVDNQFQSVPPHLWYSRLQCRFFSVCQLKPVTRFTTRRFVTESVEFLHACLYPKKVLQRFKLKCVA